MLFKQIKLWFLIPLLSISITACSSVLIEPDKIDVPDSGTVAHLPPPEITNVYAMPPPGNDVIGQIYEVKVKPDDNLSKLALQYDVTVRQIKAANPQIKQGRMIVGDYILIPKQFVLPPPEYRNGLVVNLPEARIYYFSPDGRTVKTFPVAIGRVGWRTPTGATKIIRKVKDPTWYVPDSIRDYSKQKGIDLPKKILPGKDDPLGAYALYLGIRGYLIHGTNDPNSIGKMVSSGCIRMHNEDVAVLFNEVKPGTPVYLLHYSKKVGWLNNHLYLEAHKPLSDDKGIYQNDDISPEKAIINALKRHGLSYLPLDHEQVDIALQEHTGIPIKIG